MDYEKKYKEALERAKEKYTKCYSPTLLDYIFPELKSEDVEIRRSIIRNLKRYIKCIKDGYDASSAKDFVVKEIDKQIAWLEKQGDKDSQVKLPTFTFDDILALQCCMETAKKVQNDKDLYEKLNDLHGRIYDAYYLEKQGEQETLCDKCRKEHPSHSCQDITELGRCSVEHEQETDNSYCQENCKGFQETGKCFADGDCKAKREAETIDKFKPEFKVGDWISNDMCDVHIASIEDGMYYFDEGDGLSIVFVDEHYHLWTIEDAMDGDVLVSRSPFIYGKQCPYGGLNWCNNKFIKASNFIFTDSPVHPATKEQRDFLFQKMKEAGYTFDFKNKELKKIKNDIEIPFGAKDSELQEATYFIPKGFHAEIDDDKVVIKKGEKPAAWSKKDEKMFKYALNMIEWYSGKNEDKSRYVSDWLKSLKQRIGG